MSEMVVSPCLHEENTLALAAPFFAGYQGYHVQYYFRKLRFFFLRELVDSLVFYIYSLACLTPC